MPAERVAPHCTAHTFGLKKEPHPREPHQMKRAQTLAEQCIQLLQRLIDNDQLHVSITITTHKPKKITRRAHSPTRRKAATPAKLTAELTQTEKKNGQNGHTNQNLRSEMKSFEEAFDELQRVGIDGEDLTRLAATHSAERIKSVVANVKKRPNVKNQAGYVRQALDQGWYR